MPVKPILIRNLVAVNDILARYFIYKGHLPVFDVFLGMKRFRITEDYKKVINEMPILYKIMYAFTTRHGFRNIWKDYTQRKENRT